jgi:hypothetical protein
MDAIQASGCLDTSLLLSCGDVSKRDQNEGFFRSEILFSAVIFGTPLAFHFFLLKQQIRGLHSNLYTERFIIHGMLHH